MSKRKTSDGSASLSGVHAAPLDDSATMNGAGTDDGTDHSQESDELEPSGNQLSPAPAAAPLLSATEQETALLSGEVSRDTAVLQLQAEALLLDSAVDYAKLGSSVEKALRQLREALAAIPQHEVHSSCVAGYAEAFGVGPQTLQFQPPLHITAVGSYALHSTVQPGRTVDVAMEMPRDMFRPRDHRRNYYHVRRAMYLATVAAALSQHAAFKSCEVQALRGDPRKPVLLIRGRGAGARILRLLPCLSPETFKLQALGPERNNTTPGADNPPADAAAGPPKKKKKLAAAAAGAAEGAPQPAVTAEADGKAAAEKQPPTPQYNAGVLEDMLMLTHHSYIRDALTSHPRLRDTILLLKVWARQHGLDSSDGLSGFLLSMLVAHLALKNPVAGAMTALQGVRAVLAMLAPKGALAKGLALAQPPQRPAWLPPGVAAARALAAHRKGCAAVLLDPCGVANLAAHMAAGVVAQVQMCAQQTVAVLDGATTDPDAAFSAAFLTRQTPSEAFDCQWRVTLPDSDTAKDFTADVASSRQVEQRLESLARQALGDRAKLVRVLPRSFSPAGPSALASGPLQPAGRQVLLGAWLDAAVVTRLVDIGPAADDKKAAAKFRQFWGAKSELRRFQDGKISEALLWDCPPDQRHQIADRVIEYALQRHMPGCTVTSFSGRLDFALAEPGVDGAAAAAAERLMEAALDKLGKQLRGLPNVALKVVAVQPLSAIVRKTAVFFPQPHPLAGGGGSGPVGGRLARCLEPIDVMLQLEGSGRWPDDPVAYAKAKAALGLQLGRELEAAFGLTVRASEAALDVLADGFVFRLFVSAERDQAMLTKAAQQQLAQQQQLQAPQQPQHHPHTHPASPPALLRSWHHGLVAQVGGENPAFGPSTRLAKRWVAAQLMSNHLCDEAVELLMSAVFNGKGTLPAPASRITGLLRFWQLLATFPWPVRPLVVDPTQELGAAQRRAAQQHLDAKRKQGAAHAMWIVTPKNTDSSYWTRRGPSREALQRLVLLSSIAAQHAQRLVEGSKGGSWEALFSAPLSDFDALLTLRKEALPQADRAIARKLPRARRDALTELLQSHKPAPTPKGARCVLRHIPASLMASRGASALRAELLIGFDPVAELLRLLEQRFGHLATFCADSTGGTVVGVKWHAAAFLPQELRPAIAHTSLYCSLTCELEGSRGHVVPNIMAVLAEMKALGEGLVADALWLDSASKLAAE